jgi:hypothetical protein
MKQLGKVPESIAQAATTPNDVQFGLGGITRANFMDGGFEFGRPPANTVFVTAQLARTPSRSDQQVMADALATIEANYPWDFPGVFSEVAYGLPYFRKLNPAVVSRYVPRLAANQRRSVLEEAVVAPTDVHRTNPTIKKLTFNVPVRIESNDLLFTFRGDNADVLTDVIGWLGGSNTLKGARVASPRFPAGMRFTSSRAMFLEDGLPRKLAEANNLEFAVNMPPNSPMWMGFRSQHTSSNPDGSTVTFAGSVGATLTSAKSGDYFDNGSIQHISHDILDMVQFYSKPDDETFQERVQYMFRSTPIPSEGNPDDQFTDGGGNGVIAFSPAFQGFNDAETGAQGIGTPEGEHRLGHFACLNRASRDANGTPLHLRVDGPGFDPMDVPDGSKQPKLQFSVYVPSSELFRQIRIAAASLDLQAKWAVPDEDNGLERFLTATRRQNFLIPPRRHRSFPLVELAGATRNGRPRGR